MMMFRFPFGLICDHSLDGQNMNKKNDGFLSQKRTLPSSRFSKMVFRDSMLT